jgi:hypothetical protein
MSDWPALDFGGIPDAPAERRADDLRAEDIGAEEAGKTVARAALSIARPARDVARIDELMFEAAGECAAERVRAAAVGAYLERETTESEASRSMFEAAMEATEAALRQEARRAAARARGSD